ncbi:MAG: hypothetical protein PHD30_06920, partial [Paludibacter sp.]|nr:hypothetical protein [Paludibacter sp.]
MDISPNNLVKLFLIILFTSIVYGCEKIEPDPDDNKPDQTTFIKDVIIPSQMSLVKGNSQAISGKGFATGDEIVFKTGDEEVVVSIATFTDTYATFIVPDELTNGQYSM